MSEPGDMIVAQARKAWVPFRKDADLPDVVQELWVWWYTRGSGLPEEEREPAAYRVAREYCLFEKAQRGGYEPEDQYRYTRSVVENLIPVALLEDGLPGNEVDDSPRANGPVSEGGNLPVLVADVRQALSRLGELEAWLVVSVAEGYEWAAMASQLAVDERTVRRRHVRAIDKLCGWLNGGEA